MLCYKRLVIWIMDQNQMSFGVFVILKKKVAFLFCNGSCFHFRATPSFFQRAWCVHVNIGVKQQLCFLIGDPDFGLKNKSSKNFDLLFQLHSRICCCDSRILNSSLLKTWDNTGFCICIYSTCAVGHQSLQ